MLGETSALHTEEFDHPRETAHRPLPCLFIFFKDLFIYLFTWNEEYPYLFKDNVLDLNLTGEEMYLFSGIGAQ